MGTSQRTSNRLLRPPWAAASCCRFKCSVSLFWTRRRRSDGGNHQCEVAPALPSFNRTILAATERNEHVRSVFLDTRRLTPACDPHEHHTLYADRFHVR